MCGDLVFITEKRKDHHTEEGIAENSLGNLCSLEKKGHINALRVGGITDICVGTLSLSLCSPHKGGKITTLKGRN